MKIKVNTLPTDVKINVESSNEQISAKTQSETIVVHDGGTQQVNYGNGLKYDAPTNTLSVDTTNDVEGDNTKPITSSGVYVVVGNIDELLKTI